MVGDIGVKVISWSMNWPHCMRKWVDEESCRTIAVFSLIKARETSLADGSLCWLYSLLRFQPIGRLNPFSYAAGNHSKLCLNFFYTSRIKFLIVELKLALFRY